MNVRMLQSLDDVGKKTRQMLQFAFNDFNAHTTIVGKRKTFLLPFPGWKENNVKRNVKKCIEQINYSLPFVRHKRRSASFPLELLASVDSTDSLDEMLPYSFRVFSCHCFGFCFSFARQSCMKRGLYSSRRRVFFFDVDSTLHQESDFHLVCSL